jgi:hypothetical protein
VHCKSPNWRVVRLVCFAVLIDGNERCNPPGSGQGHLYGNFGAEREADHEERLGIRSLDVIHILKGGMDSPRGSIVNHLVGQLKGLAMQGGVAGVRRRVRGKA